MVKNIERIRQYLILVIIVAFPISFSPFFVDQIGISKLILLGILLSLFFFTVAVQIYFVGKVEIPRGKFDLVVFLMIAGYLVSALFVTPNKVEAFFSPGTASFVIGLGILYFLINTIKNKDLVKYSLIVSSVFLSIFVFGSFLGVFEKISTLPAFMRSPSFNPAGDYITSTIFLICGLVFAGVFAIKEKALTKKLIFALCLAVLIIATGISVFSTVSNKSVTPLLPGFSTSWSVALDTLKESPVVGIGPGNYLTAFNRFRPVSYNFTSNWQLRFAAGRSWYLTILTESGLFGILGVVLLVIGVYKTVNKNREIYRASKTIVIDVISLISIIFILIAFLFFPAGPTVIMLFFVLLALNSQAKLHTVNMEGINLQTPRLIISVIITGLLIVLAIKARPVIMAEATFKKASDALSANDGKKTYDLLQQAINLNPYMDKYHASYAQVNLAIARSIVASVKDPKELTDDQKNTILQLIQQAIREGQNTVSLNQTRAANWQVLANIYQLVIPYATQADQFAVQSYNQTINLDPTDPNLRIALGGLYYSLGQYDNAINTFQFAVYAKNDLANAYYNLSAAYAAKNDFNNAITAMNSVITLVPKDSNDYKQAQSDLETLQKKQKDLQANSSNSSNLTTPQKQSNPVINPQLTLPSEATPPAGPKLPNASPTPIPTSSPTATP